MIAVIFAVISTALPPLADTNYTLPDKFSSLSLSLFKVTSSCQGKSLGRFIRHLTTAVTTKTRRLEAPYADARLGNKSFRENVESFTEIVHLKTNVQKLNHQLSKCSDQTLLLPAPNLLFLMWAVSRLHPTYFLFFYSKCVCLTLRPNYQNLSAFVTPAIPHCWRFVWLRPTPRKHSDKYRPLAF